jgi:hypothetical protein
MVFKIEHAAEIPRPTAIGREFLLSFAVRRA